MERKRKWVQTLGFIGIAASLYLTVFYQSTLGPLLFILSVLALIGFSTETKELKTLSFPETEYSLTPLRKQFS